MRASMGSLLSRAAICFLAITVLTFPAFAQEISSTPTSLTFTNTYVGKASGNKTLTITNLTSRQIVISTVSFSCPGFGLASGLAPFTLGTVQKITHYSIFFQPAAAQAYNCNFVITMKDGFVLNVPLTGTGLTTTAIASVSPTSLTFANQTVGVPSAPQTVTITNTGTQSVKLNAITPVPSSFTTSGVTLPAQIMPTKSLTLSVSYTPSQMTSDVGALDLTYINLID